MILEILLETYLNTEGGGYIYIGVKKTGEVVGIKEGKLDEIMLKVADVITDQVLPISLIWVWGTIHTFC